LNINLKELSAEALYGLKRELLETAAAAGGFDPTLVESIVLVQGDVVVGRHRRANPPITVKVVFKDDAVIDLDAATASLNEAIAIGAVSVTFVVDGQAFTATVIELASAIAVVTVPFPTMKRGGSQGHTFANPMVLLAVILILYFAISVTA
jgi:hypothetical protein